jgi:hypothetical protein
VFLKFYAATSGPDVASVDATVYSRRSLVYSTPGCGVINYAIVFIFGIEVVVAIVQEWVILDDLKVFLRATKSEFDFRHYPMEVLEDHPVHDDVAEATHTPPRPTLCCDVPRIAVKIQVFSHAFLPDT